MWGNYGRILSEYIYLKQFNQNKLKKFLEIQGSEILDEIKKKMNKLYLYLDILIILNLWRWR